MFGGGGGRIISCLSYRLVDPRRRVVWFRVLPLIARLVAKDDLLVGDKKNI